MELKPYRVRQGAILAHHGQELTGGTSVDLPPHVAYDVRHLVVPLDPLTGAEQPWSTPSQATFEADVARYRPHERVTLIDQRLAVLDSDVAHLRTLRAEAAAQVAAETPAAAPVAPPLPVTVGSTGPAAVGALAGSLKSPAGDVIPTTSEPQPDAARPKAPKK